MQGFSGNMGLYWIRPHVKTYLKPHTQLEPIVTNLFHPLLPIKKSNVTLLTMSIFS